MSLTFYFGSGSPFAWRAWLALEHKKVAYEPRMLSFSKGDLRTPDYTKLNPRGKVPVLVDGEFALYESAAIVEYLEERFPEGPALFPGDIRNRAVIRRVIREIDSYLMPANDKLVDELFFKSKDQWNADHVAEGKTEVLAELMHLERLLDQKEWLVGDRISAADLTLLPAIGMMARFESKKSDLGLIQQLGPNLTRWYQRFKALPMYEKTYPPHWRDN